MAVIQISKIQVRRGLQENLPQLASGEMGWSVDERRLWIGNGTLTEGAPLIGNTEILTQNSDVVSAIKSYYFRGEESGYTSVTGPTPTQIVYRSLQNKIDEQISLRDFITVADTSSGDYTAAIQRAIDQVYPLNYYTSAAVRRQLHIPAGIYPITATLTIPPYANIVGDGAKSTIIQQTYVGADSVIVLRDSKGQTGTTLGTVADLPFQVNISDLMLENTTDKDIVKIDSASDVAFTRVSFKGATSIPALVGNAHSAVTHLSSKGATSRVIYNQCQFTRTTYAISVSGNSSSVTADQCYFDTLYQGITVSANVSTPHNITVKNSVFTNISKQAIVSANTSSVTSAFNYYHTVGYGDGSSVIASTANTAVLSWNSASNYSIADTFSRDSANVAVKPLIEITGTTESTLTQRTTVGSVQDTPGYTETLTDNTTANTALSISSSMSSAIIDYSIVRNSARRTGIIKVTQVLGSVIYEDDYSEVGTMGVSLVFTGNTTANTAVLGYTTTSTGTNATLKYTLRSFI